MSAFLKWRNGAKSVRRSSGICLPAAGLPLVCINMNIAGPIKRGALIDWAFFRALNAAANSFKGKIRGFAFTNEKTGIEAMLAVDAAAESLKKTSGKH